MTNPAPAVGARVRISRDEAVYPSRGTWPEFRGKVGTIVEINQGEYGVVFGKVRQPRANGSIAMAEATWFQPHEVHALASQRAVSASNTAPPTAHPGGHPQAHEFAA
jgi:hypothetical protein